MKPIRWLTNALVILLLGIALGVFIYRHLTRQEKPQPTITTQELQLKVQERLRLITKEITYREDVNLYHAGQHAVGTADLVGYVKYDLEALQIDRQGDTIWLTLPEPQIELGRRPGGEHRVRYYLDQGGRPSVPSADRQAIAYFDKQIKANAERVIREDPHYLQESQQQAESQLGQLIVGLDPQAIVLFRRPLHMPNSESPGQERK